ncbi:hypothetical protein ACHAWF_009142, partial [Thalassiosira exigua]
GLDEIRHGDVAPAPAALTPLTPWWRTLLPAQVPPASGLGHDDVGVLQAVVQLPRELAEDEEVVSGRHLQERDGDVSDVSVARRVVPVFLPVAEADSGSVRRERVVPYQVGRRSVVQLSYGGAEQRFGDGAPETGLAMSPEGTEVLQDAPLHASPEDHVPREGDSAGVDVQRIPEGGATPDALGQGPVEGLFPEVFGDDVGSQGVAQHEDGPPDIWIIVLSVASVARRNLSPLQPVLDLLHHAPQVSSVPGVVAPGRAVLHLMQTVLPAKIHARGDPPPLSRRPHHGPDVPEAGVVVEPVQEQDHGPVDAVGLSDVYLRLHTIARRKVNENRANDYVRSRT